MSMAIVNGWEIVVRRLEGRDIDKEALLTPNGKKGKIKLPPSEALEVMLNEETKKPWETVCGKGVLPQYIHKFLEPMLLGGVLLMNTPLDTAISLANKKGKINKGKDTLDFLKEVDFYFGASKMSNEFPKKLFQFVDTGEDHYIVLPYNKIDGISLYYLTMQGTTILNGSPYWSNSFGILLYKLTTTEQAKLYGKSSAVLLEPPFKEISAEEIYQEHEIAKFINELKEEDKNTVVEGA